jgi:hypothetical protein
VTHAGEPDLAALHAHAVVDFEVSAPDSNLYAKTEEREHTTSAD